MGHSPFLLKHPRSVAIALSLFLILLYLCSCYCNISLSAAFLTLLLLAFSTCSLSLFSYLRRLRESTDSAVKPRSSEQEEMKGGEESSKKPASESSSVIVDKSSKEDSISSDDESLIEIALPEGSYAGDEDELLSEFSPEWVLKQNGLMELLAEINEEDNLIEIDIVRGSIKCSRLGIKA